jgi:hypothetical protein
VKAQDVKVVALNMEWDIDKYSILYKVALIQVGYRALEGTIWVALFLITSSGRIEMKNAAFGVIPTTPTQTDS